jgi:Trehalase-like, N-terminal
VLVGYDEHGRWALRPTVPVREMAQRYRDDTMTLETEFVCDGGAVRVTDFMPVSEERCDVVRIVDGLDGEVSPSRCSWTCASGTATTRRGSGPSPTACASRRDPTPSCCARRSRSAWRAAACRPIPG